MNIKYKKLKLTVFSNGDIRGDNQITCRKKYLVKYDGEKYIDYFSRQWYGLSFNGIYPAGIGLHNILEEGGKVYEILKIKKEK